MKERLKKLRKHMGMSQDEFAQAVGLTKNYISLVENGYRSLAERTTRDVCKKFNVSYDWLVNGIGEMFAEIPEEDLYSKAAASLLKDGDALAIEGLKLYFSLPPEEKKTAMDFVLKLADAIRERDDKENE